MPLQLAPGQRRKPKQLRSRLMVETILEAARQIFAEHGFEAATTNQIAERAGISIGSLYQYFPNKDSLILEIQRMHHDELLALIRSAMDKSGKLPLREAVRSIIGANLDMHLSEARLHGAFEEWIPAQTQLVDRERFQQEMVGLINGFLDSRPELPKGQAAKSAVFVIMNLVKSVMHAAISDAKAAENREQILDHVVDGILACLQPLPENATPPRPHH